MQINVRVIISALSLASLAAANPVPRNEPTGQCNTGELQCCNSVQAANSSGATSLLGPLGIVLGDVTALVGINCSPISVVGVVGNSCNTQPVCCTDNSFNGLVSLGCTPINLNL
ncbi:Fruiting body protein SC1 [Psilocybe cubensis]|uniref:Hydrophobin n=3 Tax=Psilocybe cubensis TaxID=181762 RepID=A0A8H7XWY2_PSICU|nr:Fruiting body protein SC1 [Psilocybe cubensis]XP_047744307.1 Fruiting body protein SC1 [Psilocybe cubensis]KAH9476556.1 Fruiting body protein SC1 [Psilocybe cubensis]KAH9476682.1 Fruiting body protein SC1 [Psilocybe cubensis]